MTLYRRALRPVLLRADPERVHDRATRAAELVSGSATLCRVVGTGRTPADERLAVDVAGLRFRTPIGLAAGFDKSARAAHALAALGFGHGAAGH